MLNNYQPVILLKLKYKVKQDVLDKLRKNIEAQIKQGFILIDDSFDYEIIWQEERKDG